MSYLDALSQHKSCDKFGIFKIFSQICLLLVIWYQISQHIDMVLEFNDDGALPEGIHEMLLEDFKKQFVYNNRREQIFQGFLLLIKDLRAINCKAVFVDGSFVTSKEVPGDVDVCWDDDDEINWELLESDYPIFFDMDPPRDAQQLRYHADVFPANLNVRGSGMMFKDFFQQHKETGNPKGIIKINIRYDKE